MVDKPSFRHAFANHRCLVVADGFYEWRKTGKVKVPVYISLKSKKLFGFAGLHEHWRAHSGEIIRTCTIITTDANELVRPSHDRMPVILHEDAENLWLDPGMHDRERLLALLKPYPAEEMDAYDVNTAVNNTLHDAPDCIIPAAK